MRGLTQSEKPALEMRPKPKSIDFLFDEKRKASWRVLLFVRQSPDEPDATSNYRYLPRCEKQAAARNDLIGLSRH
jgi:hypothetical protein